MKYVMALLHILAIGCANTGHSNQEIMGAEQKMIVCDGDTQLPAEVAFSEEDFSLASAMRSMDFLKERINPIISELNQAPDAPAIVDANWEYLYIGRPNAFNKINGYLLKRQAETAPMAERAAAEAKFCEFLKRTAVTD